ncbi:MAG TPA: hypothetical protein VFM15_05145, partial [Gammaproteobacteria bacterium]|nr:hypothetical protein [Gammaproteobacteria bacterium]
MTLMLQISPPPSTEISAQTMMDTGLHRWLWLIWYRLKRHSASRINLLIFGVGILIGLMQQFGHGHPDRMFPFLLAIFLCGMPSGLFYNLVIEISNIPAARLWPERMKGTWSLYVLAGVLTISIYMLLAWGSLPGVELFLVGTLFYASGLYPASLIAIYFALIGVTWKMPQILTTHVLAASLTLVASGMAVAAMGVLRIRRRWLGDHRVQWLPGMDKKRPGSRSAQRNRPGWKSGAFKTDAQSVARVLRFESRLVSRWAMHWMITAAALFTCIVVFILGVQYSTNHQHMDEAVMVTALLLGFMLTATFISSEIAVRVPDKRWLPISRKLYARGIWVAHLQSLLQFSVLLAVLASACVLAVMRLLDVSHAPSWLNCTFAS